MKTGRYAIHCSLARSMRASALKLDTDSNIHWLDPCERMLRSSIQTAIFFGSIQASMQNSSIQASSIQTAIFFGSIQASMQNSSIQASCIVFKNVSANASMSIYIYIYIYICLCIYMYIYRRLHLHLNVLCIWCNGHKYMYLTARTESLTHTSCSSCEPRLKSTH